FVMLSLSRFIPFFLLLHRPPRDLLSFLHDALPIYLLDLLRVILGGLLPDLRVRAGTEAAGVLLAHVQLDVGVRHQQRLRIGVDGDELDALQAGFDHAVDRVDTAAADADDLDDCEIVLGSGHVTVLALVVLVWGGACIVPGPTTSGNPRPRVEVRTPGRLPFTSTLWTSARGRNDHGCVSVMDHAGWGR